MNNNHNDRGALLTISTKAMAHNLAVIKSKTHAKVLAMVKADAYGHTMAAAVRGFKMADAFGVATFAEAVAVRALSNKPIVVLEGAFSLDEWRAARDLNIVMAITTPRHVDWARECPTALPVWLKYNSGMNRLGLDEHGAIDAAKILHAHGTPIILTTHLAQADECSTQGQHATTVQLSRLTALSDTLGALGIIHKTSGCNSSGIINHPKAHGDWVRAGIALYGGIDDNGYLPAMRLSAPIIHAFDVPKDAPVGYGGAWTATKNTRVGIVAVGYGDGYPRLDTGRVSAQAQGKRVALNLAGRVSMDMLAIDLQDYALGVGDEITLFGDKVVSATDVAHWANTISYEIFCRQGRRVGVRVIDDILP